jgi:crotonobetainyl-CoA:carnitine CoA-transferase CaiB-like acyl-CoA transferase
MGSDLAVQLKFGRLASNRTRDNPLNPIATFFKSADGHWFVHNPRGGSGGWEKFVEAAGRPDLVDDARFATGRARREHSRELVAELDAAFAATPMEEIARRLDAADLVWAPVQTPAEVAADPQVAASGALVQVEDEAGGTFPNPAAPARFPGADATVRPRSPKIGEHTREVLAEIGYAAKDIDSMFATEAAA